MINYYISLSLLLLVADKSCNKAAQNPQMNMEQAVVQAIDEPFANVFKALDGDWEGEFTIYAWQGELPEQLPDPALLSSSYLKSLPIQEVNRIHVQQSYHSLSPFYQKVEITDTYQENGLSRKVISHGVNKIENGKMWCIVQKPDEQIIHTGSLQGEHTIIWERALEKPLKIEHFRETVLAESYEIIGYGYYGDDDPQLGPRTWFHGKYQRP